MGENRSGVSDEMILCSFASKQQGSIRMRASACLSALVEAAHGLS